MSKQYDYIKEGLTDQNFRLLPYTLMTLGIMLVCSLLYANNWFTVIGVRENLMELGPDVFLKYMFIIVAVERAAAVFVAMFRSQNTVDWALRIRRINEILQKENPSKAILQQVFVRENRLIKKLEQAEIIGQIDDLPTSPTREDYLGFLTSSKHAYEFQKARFDSISNRYVARIVFFVGILLATLGLSIFHDLFQNLDLVTAMKTEIANGALSATGLKWQQGLLRLTDIIVTGGLLGGGSAGLNALSNKMTEFMNKQ
ncbi:MAG: hypothetical protein DWQ10_13800 [Calditrichaeota bacterium]|nr:MAG: hypothetical protein DWQ10_13800 [Calditrichota bacterium]